jgi:hypothetical protein
MYLFKEGLNETDTSNNIIYNYPDTTINNQYKNNTKSDGYIKIPYTNPKNVNNPNLIYSPSNMKYQTTNIYIFSKAHDFPTQYDGELIIEQTPITNGIDKVYTCILLKTDSNLKQQTTIDQIIGNNFSPSLLLNLNEYLTNTTCIANTDKTVFVFMKPVSVISSFINFDKNNIPNIFSKYSSSDYHSISALQYKEGFTHEIKEGFQEGLSTGDGTYMECSPVTDGNSAETVSLIPISNQITDQLNTSSLVNTTMNFFTFLILVAVAVSIAPFLYKNSIIWFVKSMSDEGKAANNLKTFDIFVVIILFAMIGTFSAYGISNSNVILSSGGMFFFIFTLLSIFVITILKITNPGTYSLIEKPGEAKFSLDIFVQIFGFIISNWFSIFKMYFIIQVILIIITLVLYYTNIIPEYIRNLILQLGMTLTIPMTLFIVKWYSKSPVQ